MLEKEFTPKAEALALKELGFDEPCLATIDQTESVQIKGTEHTMGGAMFYFTIDAPTYSQAFRFLYKQLGRDGFGIMPVDTDKCNKELNRLIQIIKEQ